MLKQRSQEKETLEGLNITGTQLASTMSGLALINRYLGNINSTRNAFNKVINELSLASPIKIIDLGCGSGDVLRAIADLLRKLDLPANLNGIDGNPAMVDLATSLSKDYPEIVFHCVNVMDEDYALDPCDILFSSHFIYHFEDQALSQFLIKNKANIAGAIIFSDLHRHWLPYIVFGFCSVFSGFKSILRQDGLAAIRRAFTISELDDVIRAAQFNNFEINWCLPFRLQSIIYLHD